MSYCLCTHTQFVLCSCLGTLKCTRPRNIPFALFLDNLQSFRMFWFDLWYVEISTRGLWCTQSEAWVETNQLQQRVSINWPIRGRVKDLAIISCCNILWDGKHDWNLEFMSTDYLLISIRVVEEILPEFVFLNRKVDNNPHYVMAHKEAKKPIYDQ